MPMQRQGQQHKRIPWKRVSIASILSLLFTGGAIVGIVNNLNSLFNVLSIIFGVLSALFALFQWLFPFSSPNSAESSLMQPPPLIPPITVHLSPPPTVETLDTKVDVSLKGTEQLISLWTVPYRRNPFFTGREALLTYLHKQLNENQSVALSQAQAINGLGGIGKTQTAVEYAYRYRHDYRHILWIRTATTDTLISDFVMIANLLQIAEKDDQDYSITVAAVKRWLEEHKGWLLILDNADDLEVIRGRLPTGNNGHILITTRSRAVGSIAHSIEVEKMEGEEGTLFLMRRARILEPEASLSEAGEVERAQAEAIVATMDGLPLALDQAGAYIEETECGLSRYLDLYRTHHRNLLQRRGQLPTDHPESVATTWSLSFQKIEQINSASADLLRLCAFLDPDAIPEELLIEGASDLGSTLNSLATNPLKFDKVIEEVLRYSLMRRNVDTKTLSIHRLVQAVLRDRMNQKTQRKWAERVVRAVNRMFPEVSQAVWTRCQRYLPHAQACATFINHFGLAFSEAAQLLTKAGYYLQEVHGQYEEAESLFRRALSIREQMLGLDHPETASILDHLGQLYRDQANYMEAESLFRRALGICEETLGSDHPETAHSLRQLGNLYSDEAKYGEAESVFQRALAIDTQMLGPDHPSTAHNLLYLGRLYLIQGRYKEAEPMFQRALKIHEQVLGPDHFETANCLEHLGWLYRHQGKYKEAEHLVERALTIYEQVLKPGHPSTATRLDGLGRLYRDRGRYKEAEVLHQQALAIKKQVLRSSHPEIASSYEHLGSLYILQGRYKEAEPLLERALTVYEEVFQRDHPSTIVVLQFLGLLYLMQGRYKQAEPFLERALTMSGPSLGSMSYRVGILREEYALLLLRTGRVMKAIQAGVQGLRVLGLRETIRYAVIALRMYKLQSLQNKRATSQ